MIKKQQIEEEEVEQEHENEQKQQINYEIDALLKLEGASPLKQRSTLASKNNRQNNDVSFMESETDDNIKNK